MGQKRSRRLPLFVSVLILLVCAAGAIPTVTLQEPDENAIRAVTEDFDVRGVFDSDPGQEPENKPSATIRFEVRVSGSTLWKKSVYPFTHGDRAETADYKDDEENDLDWPAGPANVYVLIAVGQPAPTEGLWEWDYHSITFEDNHS